MKKGFLDNTRQFVIFNGGNLGQRINDKDVG
jgi:hypothetical protein